MASIFCEKITLPLSELIEGVTKFKFTAPFRKLNGVEDKRFPDLVHIDTHVTGMSDDFYIVLKVNSIAKLICDRCDVNFQMTITGDLATLYTFDNTKIV